MWKAGIQTNNLLKTDITVTLNLRQDPQANVNPREDKESKMKKETILLASFLMVNIAYASGNDDKTFERELTGSLKIIPHNDPYPNTIEHSISEPIDELVFLLSNTDINERPNDTLPPYVQITSSYLTPDKDDSPIRDVSYTTYTHYPPYVTITFKINSELPDAFLEEAAKFESAMSSFSGTKKYEATEVDTINTLLNMLVKHELMEELLKQKILKTLSLDQFTKEGEQLPKLSDIPMLGWQK